MPHQDAPPSAMTLRWQRWQHSPVAQHYLTPEARAQGYTVLKIPPQSREAFFLLVDVLLARGRVEHQLLRRLEAPATVLALQEVQAAWAAWRTWTRRLAAYLERVAAGRDGTRPPVPAALHALLAGLEEGDHADTAAS